MHFGIRVFITLTFLGPAAWAGSKFEQDRAAILAMAGAYKVDFKFDETVTLAGEASKPYRSEALELVEVVEDSGRVIRLQHVLLAGGHVVKHWRQDWVYEDRLMYVYRGHQAWEPVQLSRREREGAWTQAVFNVDDSPRYEGVGRWVHADGHSMWESGPTWRPLPRREYTKRDDYDVIGGRNRHSITKDGWLHLQDNYKLALRDGKETVLAYETGVNTYTKTDAGALAAAAAEWKKSEAFWRVVRAYWDASLNGKQRVAFKDAGDEESVLEAFGAIAEEAEQQALAGDALMAFVRDRAAAALIYAPARAAKL